MKKRIEKALRNALLNDGEMDYELYKFEVKAFVDIWKKGMHEENEEFVFAVDVSDDDVAMVLITKNDKLYINEKAREKLKSLWADSYTVKIESLLPEFIEQLSEDIIPLQSVSFVNDYRTDNEN